MGLTSTKVRVSNPRHPRKQVREVEVLVDTGAIYSVLPSATLAEIGIRPMEREEFTLADGTHKRYAVGEAFFEFGGKAGTSKVVFAPRATTPLLGALTLESLGLMVNPVTRELAPMRLILAGKRRLASDQSGGMTMSNRRNVMPPVKSMVAPLNHAH